MTEKNALKMNLDHERKIVEPSVESEQVGEPLLYDKGSVEP
ncbi:hypothetical protein NXV33_07530 [Bacteroides thetaiotaomicron]|nr:hypothetical protein [Bacteroides thetaiotaomicron]